MHFSLLSYRVCTMKDILNYFIFLYTSFSKIFLASFVQSAVYCVKTTKKTEMKYYLIKTNFNSQTIQNRC